MQQKVAERQKISRQMKRTSAGTSDGSPRAGQAVRLALRLIAPNDYIVLEDRQPIGRIRLAPRWGDRQRETETHHHLRSAFGLYT